jgi:hypothetical protein
MRTVPQRFLSLLGLLVVVSLLASCSKEELVEPCDHTTNEAKAASNDEGEATDPVEASENTNENDPDGNTISDDGDDLSGSERNRKKKPN